MDWKRVIGWIAVGLLMITLGGCGTGCMLVVREAYLDHQLLNEIRANQRQIQAEQAAQIQRFQQQQQAQPQAKPPQ